MESKPDTTTGSSPLARGLPLAALAGGHDRGIIPARAGFTVLGGPPDGLPEDHPRSRGVYRMKIKALDANGGSSPLARGLLPPQVPFGPVRRIIPARAGFTASGMSAQAGSQDHPRSRGVYEEQSPNPDWSGGSSPLARGLLSGSCRLCGTPTDHPRSRGVYPSRLATASPTGGSSPLARGLPPGSA